MKATFYLENYLKNLPFNIDNKLINRDNYAYSHYLLKKIFYKNGMDLSTYDINSINDSKIVIYNDMPKVLPNEKDIHKSYLLLFESELIKPENWDFEKHKYFNKIFTWDDRIIDNKKYFKINFSHLFPKSINKDLSKKEKLCTLIAGNKKVNHPLELYSKRVEAIRWFEKNYPLDFDFYGMGWDEYTPSNKYIRYGFRKLKLSKLFQLLKPNFPSYKGKVDSKKEVLEKYKFAICYENARDIDGYITEKIFDCFFAGCVPIYWGANNIIEHIPKECFIDKREFDSYEKLYEFITNITHEEYLKYLDAIENYLNSSKADEFRAEYFANTIVETILNDIR
ncbi:glycosyltransferase family 10 [Aliarcobacter butzleri]|uniref:glycosyltransferase family 10 domain-containing protein n=1 Tax=Aliarcobacter butzleri TaxID=28197 RepID=UPI001EDC8ED1|nr:glycosyltransferase family 10 [Aliarcobacter butzleri]MCG3686184.1 glycosyltransferase family 10 [Aliarcobacter butzleri]